MPTNGPLYGGIWTEVKEQRPRHLLSHFPPHLFNLLCTPIGGLSPTLLSQWAAREPGVGTAASRPEGPGSRLRSSLVLPVWSLHVLPVWVRDFAVSSGFPPTVKHMHVTWNPHPLRHKTGIHSFKLYESLHILKGIMQSELNLLYLVFFFWSRHL